jgi:hypothetical protein
LTSNEGGNAPCWLFCKREREQRAESRENREQRERVRENTEFERVRERQNGAKEGREPKRGRESARVREFESPREHTDVVEMTTDAKEMVNQPL